MDGYYIYWIGGDIIGRDIDRGYIGEGI